MDYEKRLENSYYNTIATINGAHKIYLVQHRESGKIYIRKILDVYNLNIYEYLLEHHIPGIPRIYHISEEDGQLNVIEEFISGTSLRELIDSGTLTLDLVLQYMMELCGIMENLHSLNPPVIHRDIKPSNIIITPCNHVFLLDFNAAKYLTKTENRDTVLLGTRGYAAPEQYGFGFSTPQTDIYALGIVLKELSDALPVPTDLFDPIIRKCTEMNPSDRMETVQELKIEIEKLQIHNNKNIRAILSGWKEFIPPGFRTKTPWKMLIAVPVYMAVFWMCLLLEVKDASVFQIWVERITVLLIMLSLIFCSFNYRNIQGFIPLCKSKYRLVRYLGILILNAIITVSFLIAMSLVETIF